MRNLPLRAALLPLFAALLLFGCSSTAGGAGGGGRSTSDPRVRSLRGTTPPALPANGTWLNARGPTSLAALRGRVVYVQFAFPT